MSSAHDAAARIRAIGLFDLQPTLPGLLGAIAAFCETHAIRAPRDVRWTEDRSRGFLAQLELEPADFFRVAAGYPMPVRLTLTAAGQLQLETDLRAGVLRTTVAHDALEGHVTPEGLLFRMAAPG